MLVHITQVLAKELLFCASKLFGNDKEQAILIVTTDNGRRI